MKLGTDFKLRDDSFSKEKYDAGETLPIELLVSPYEGVVYRYTRVALVENENKDGAVMKFDYEIIDPGKFSMVKLRGDNYFNKAIGLVLNEILLDYMEGAENGAENRGNDTTKPDTE